MQVIPVIDLKKGEVVRARFGLRSTYAPIVTPLAETSKPADVVAGFLKLYPFGTIYVADLDAIERKGRHDRVITELIAQFPEVTFWVDPGIATAEAARAWLDRFGRAHLVLGAETLSTVDPLRKIGTDPRILLSLDFDEERLLGPEGLIEAKAVWPERIIVMTLARVGSAVGPDFERIAAIAALAPRARIFAAGGLRGADDLACSARAGAEGILVASALHDGRLTKAEIAAAGKAGDREK
jgi:phosphoribosylformimino-5-aminoimidazole carboxamide ribotide isomerase